MNENPASHSEAAKAGKGRVLILEPSQEIASEIVSALQEAVPNAHVEVARTLEEAQHLVLDAKPDLFVLDVDATYDLGQEFLYDLRTSHPNARAIILTAIHLAAQREQAQGLGAIHFLEKPFPRADFVMLAQALLIPSNKSEGEKFQGTLSDLHIADIVQLKCMSGSTSVLEFTGPAGEKARIFFENGQVKHAVAPRKEGIPAFNEIVNWKGGMISEVSGALDPPRTIDLDWQLLLMEAVRKIDETRGEKSAGGATGGQNPNGRKILVIDDSLMLLSFVCEILTESNYQVESAATGEEGLQLGMANPPDLVLLDYVLPDMRGDEVSRRLYENPATKDVPILYMSGLGGDLRATPEQSANVTGFLNKPFTSDTLLRTIETYMPTMDNAGEHAAEPKQPAEPSFESQTPAPASPESAEPSAEPEPTESLASPEPSPAAEPEAESQPWWGGAPEAAAAEAVESTETTVIESFGADERFAQPQEEPSFYSGDVAPAPQPVVSEGGAFFSGDTNFFSLHWALRAIASEKLTGALRCFWDKAVVELLSEDGAILLVTTRDPDLYCPEAPITLVNVDPDQIEQARGRQMENGCPMFVTLAEQNLILREPGMQLVQHYGQKLFAQLWTAQRVRFAFEQTQLPDYARDVPREEDIDQWALNTLRFIQYQELGEAAAYDAESIPAFTSDGFARVQNLRLTVAEAQFASQFNGARSIMQIAKNLRLDLKFARLTLFRFLALEIVECWPAGTAEKQERKGLLARIGFGG